MPDNYNPSYPYIRPLNKIVPLHVMTKEEAGYYADHSCTLCNGLGVTQGWYCHCVEAAWTKAHAPQHRRPNERYQTIWERGDLGVTWGLCKGVWCIGGTPDLMCEYMFDGSTGLPLNWWLEWFDAGDKMLYYEPSWTPVASSNG